MLPQKAIQEFKQLYFEETGINLDDQLALEYATQLINLFKVIIQPVKQNRAVKNEQK